LFVVTRTPTYLFGYPLVLITHVGSHYHTDWFVVCWYYHLVRLIRFVITVLMVIPVLRISSCLRWLLVSCLPRLGIYLVFVQVLLPTFDLFTWYCYADCCWWADVTLVSIPALNRCRTLRAYLPSRSRCCLCYSATTHWLVGARWPHLVRLHCLHLFGYVVVRVVIAYDYGLRPWALLYPSSWTSRWLHELLPLIVPVGYRTPLFWIDDVGYVVPHTDVLPHGPRRCCYGHCALHPDLRIVRIGVGGAALVWILASSYKKNKKKKKWCSFIPLLPLHQLDIIPTCCGPGPRWLVELLRTDSYLRDYDVAGWLPFVSYYLARCCYVGIGWTDSGPVWLVIHIPHFGLDVPEPDSRWFARCCGYIPFGYPFGLHLHTHDSCIEILWACRNTQPHVSEFLDPHADSFGCSVPTLRIPQLPNLRIIPVVPVGRTTIVIYLPDVYLITLVTFTLLRFPTVGRFGYPQLFVCCWVDVGFATLRLPLHAFTLWFPLILGCGTLQVTVHYYVGYLHGAHWFTFLLLRRSHGPYVHSCTHSTFTVATFTRFVALLLRLFHVGLHSRSHVGYPTVLRTLRLRLRPLPHLFTLPVAIPTVVTTRVGLPILHYTH